MESNLPVMSKRVWSIVRVVFIMLLKGFTKRKLLMMDLNLMLKRPGKLAGNAIANVISHNNHHRYHGTSSAASHYDAHWQFTTAREFEFSCSNTPNYSVFSKSQLRHFFACIHAPLTLDNDNALKVTLEMLDDDKKYSKDVVKESPAPPGFGHTPAVRQLKVTDSPFPMQDGNDDGDHQVDMAAEEFINRFFR